VLPVACAECGQIVSQQPELKIGLLIERDGAVLLVQRSQRSQELGGAWTLPGGRFGTGQLPLVTAVRNTAVATGLRVQAGKLVDVYHYDQDPGGCGLLLVYAAAVIAGEPSADGAHAVHAGFFLPGQVPEPLGGGGHDQAVAAWRRRSLERWQPGMPMQYCPHCTHPLEERLAFDRLRSVCPACGFVHFRAPKVGVSMLVEQGDRLLLIRRAVEPGQGKWCLPSGFVEWDESPQAAAVRECKEETGLVVADACLLDVTHYTDDFRGPGINLTYCVTVQGGTLRPGDDAAETQFFSASELPPEEAIAFQSHRLLLAKWFRQRACTSGALQPSQVAEQDSR
jgi:8-oxo-dGTP diphosphatase